MHHAITWLVETIGNWGYPGIFVLMTIESSLFPFPSEVVMIPAGYIAYQGEMSFVAAFLCGVGGSLAGANFNYYLALVLGKPILRKYGKWFFLPPEKLDKGEAFFRRHGEVGTFTCRLIPGVRQLISLPAGLARMNLVRFNLFTGLGAGIWMAVLLWVGWFCGKHEQNWKDFWRDYKLEITAGALGTVVLILAVYIWFQYRKKKTS